MAYPVSKKDFVDRVSLVLQELPEPFSHALDEVTLDIRPRPTTVQLRNMEMNDDELLLGLYVGTAMTDRSVEQATRLPDVIYLFQNNIEHVSDSSEQLQAQIRTTVLHELGHHFGLDEDELDALGYG
jgi:predicted Zn-dependent protease with MMP-like domain